MRIFDFMKLIIGKKKFNVVRCKNPLLGMMFKDFSEFDGMLFNFSWKDRWTIWTPFCVPMDLVFLDKNKVVEVIPAKPWRIYSPKIKSKTMVEMRYGSGLKVGDVVKW